MLEEKEIKKIIELKEKGLTVKDISKTVGCSESSVKKYTSDDYEKDNEIDGKTAKALSDRMLEEYDFEEGIIPLVYKLKIQANEINVNLFDYLKDISDTMSKFLRITSKPEWFYYVFMELANSLSVITDHIEANDLMNAIDNFYNREIEMENAEAFITEIETKIERILENTEEEYNNWQNEINEAQKEHTRITSLNNIVLVKMMSDPNKEKLKESEENLINMENQMKRLQNANQLLIAKCKSLEQTDKDNEIIKQENIAFNLVYNKLEKVFPQQIQDIIKEIENEIQ